MIISQTRPEPMLRTVYFSIIVVFTIASACKKDKLDHENPEPANEKPKQCRILSGPISTKGMVYFKYNEDSSIKSINTQRSLYKYYYHEDKLIAVVLDDNFGYPTDSIYTDGAGVIKSISSYGLYDDDEERAKLYNVSFLYNSKNKIVQANYEVPRYYYGNLPYSVAYGVRHYYYNEKGNIIKETDSIKGEDGVQKLTYTAVYEYDSMRNPFYLLPIFSLFQNSNLIMMSPNNITKKHEFFENGKENISNYSYAYLLEGYPTEVNVNYPLTNVNAVSEYKYECK